MRKWPDFAVASSFKPEQICTAVQSKLDLPSEFWFILKRWCPSLIESIAVSLFVNNETAMLSSPSAFEDFKYFTLSCEGIQSYSFFGNNHDSAKIISILFELHVYVIISSRHNLFSQVEVVMLSLTTIDASCHA